MRIVAVYEMVLRHLFVTNSIIYFIIRDNRTPKTSLIAPVLLLPFGYSLRKHAHVIFHGCKKDNLHMKKCDVFLIFAQNIDCGHTLEPPHSRAASMRRF